MASLKRLFFAFNSAFIVMCKAIVLPILAQLGLHQRILEYLAVIHPNLQGDVNLLFKVVEGRLYLVKC